MSPDLKKLYRLILKNDWAIELIIANPSWKKECCCMIEIVSPHKMVDSDIYLYKVGD